MKAVLLIGLPGSGKTYIAQTDYVSRGYILVDDPTDLDEVRAGVATALAGGNPGVVVCDPHLTRAGTRAIALQVFPALGCTEVECVYFENDPVKAARNLQHRADSRGHISVEVFSRQYEIPAGVVPRDIWQPEI